MSNNTRKDTRVGGNSRRRVLKTALLGGASVTAFKLAPESWTRPVVEAVSLPAHAQMSVILPDGPWASGGEILGPGPARDRGLGARMLNAVLPEARAAGNEIPEKPLIDECDVFGICIDKVDENTIFVRVGFNGFQIDSNNVNVSESGGLLTFNESFGLLNVNGELSADGQIWMGRVEGPCLIRTLKDDTDNPEGPMQRIRTALVNNLVSSARAGFQDDFAAPDIDKPWEAQIDVPCGLTDELDFD